MWRTRIFLHQRQDNKNRGNIDVANKVGMLFKGNKQVVTQRLMEFEARNNKKVSCKNKSKKVERVTSCP